MTELVQHVQAGACVRSGGAPGVFGMAVGCALEREDCEGAIFRSSRELNLAGPQTVGYLCLGFGIDATVGRCADDDSYVCTSSAESCVNEDGFVPFSDDCSVLVDTSPQRFHNRTYFGGCANTAFPFSTKCYWSKADCITGSDNMQWMSAGSNSECTCEETLTGACESNGKHYCAVSEFGCDEDSTFISAADLPADMTCFLCDTHHDSIIEMFAQIDEPKPSTSQNQSAPQDSFPTESPQDEPTQGAQESSTERSVPTALPASAPGDSTERVQPHFEKDNDTVAVYVGIPTVLLFTLLLFCAITCTGSPKTPKPVSDKIAFEEEDDGWVASEDDKGLVASGTGELA